MAITNDELKALFPEIEITEDTLLKIKIMVESAIKAKVDAATSELTAAHDAAIAKITEDLEDAIAARDMLKEQAEEYAEYVVQEMTEKATSYAEYVVQEMTEKVDAYAEYVVEKFIEDNQQALQEGQEYARMQSVFESVKSAFEQAGYELTAVDKSAEHDAAIAEAKASYNELFDKHQKLIKENEEMQYAMVFESLTKDLADTQKEKLKSLIESVSFEGVSEFKRGVELMIAQISEGAASAATEEQVEAQTQVEEQQTEVQVEEQQVEEKKQETTVSPMAKYLNVL